MESRGRCPGQSASPAASSRPMITETSHAVPSMKRASTRLLFAAVLAVVLAIAGAQDKKYADTYDDLDVDSILTNDEERTKYYNCFMDTGPCHTDAAVFFKGHAAEAVVTSCKYCTDKQIAMFEKIVSWYVDNRPDEWNRVIEKTIADARAKGLTP